MINVAVITHGRAHLLRQCVENVLARAELATEIVIWDNASEDGTRDYLRGLDNPRVRVILHNENIGQNAYARIFPTTTQPFLIELDDDVIDAPQGWDRMLLEAYEKLPGVGFLSASLMDDPYDWCAKTMWHDRPHLYRADTVNGVGLLRGGPVGGYCAITDRALHDRVGGFPERPGETFFPEDGLYVEAVQRAGHEAAILEPLRVHHAGGDYYSAQPAAKLAYLEQVAREARGSRLKRGLLRIPGVQGLNDRRRAHA